MYARAYLEGRLDEKHLQNFRQELAEGGGLSSYPHPYLMPDFWQFPTVSMGLGPIMSLYQARFNRYLQARGLTNWKEEPKVWAFLGDGESDEPESLGAITLAARENLDNIIWVINCNLQRLDGPVRGNGKIIQELEGLFRGAGWNVIKVIWGTDWDDIIERDKSGLLLKRMEECVDGDYQKYVVEPGSYTRKHFFGKYPELLELVNHLTDEQISKLLRGGHDVRKMYAAYKAAIEHKGQPTVILAKTVKGYGLGEAGEGKNISHQQKKMNEKELREFRERFNIPISDDVIAETPFFRPAPDSAETKYLLERRKALGGFVPARIVKPVTLDVPKLDYFAEFLKGSATDASTTMAFVRLITLLLRHKGVGKNVVPIIPDEARTFGMDALFKDYRHLLAERPALRAGGQKIAAVLSRKKGRPDSRRRHQRIRRDVILHRRRHQLRVARRADDSVLRLLFDVRSAARRRFVLARGRHPREGLFARRHFRPHLAQRRRSATSGRPQSAAREHDSDLPAI